MVGKVNVSVSRVLGAWEVSDLKCQDGADGCDRQGCCMPGGQHHAWCHESSESSDSTAIPCLETTLSLGSNETACIFLDAYAELQPRHSLCVPAPFLLPSLCSSPRPPFALHFVSHSQVMAPTSEPQSAACIGHVGQNQGTVIVCPPPPPPPLALPSAPHSQVVAPVLSEPQSAGSIDQIGRNTIKAQSLCARPLPAPLSPATFATPCPIYRLWCRCCLSPSQQPASARSSSRRQRRQTHGCW